MLNKLKEFDNLGVIGKGSYGVVYKVRRKMDSKIYVLKCIDINGMSRQEQQDTVNEVKILASFQHPYIVQYYDSFISTRDQKLYIVMEYAANGSLYQKLQV